MQDHFLNKPSQEEFPSHYQTQLVPRKESLQDYVNQDCFIYLFLRWSPGRLSGEWPTITQLCTHELIGVQHNLEHRNPPREEAMERVQKQRQFKYMPTHTYDLCHLILREEAYCLGKGQTSWSSDQDSGDKPHSVRYREQYFNKSAILRRFQYIMTGTHAVTSGKGIQQE